MIKEGHEKVNRHYDNYIEYPEDYLDLRDESIYFDWNTRQYKVKFYCAECGADCGWYCYEFNRFDWLWHELESGMVCQNCFHASPCDYSEGG